VKRSRLATIALAGLFVWQVGCTSWTPIGVSELADHGKVRVTLINGDRESVYDPWVEADSIKGHRHIETLAFPVDEVAKLESHSTDEVGTALVVLGGILAAVAIAGLIDCASNGGYGCPF